MVVPSMMVACPEYVSRATGASGAFDANGYDTSVTGSSQEKSQFLWAFRPHFSSFMCLSAGYHADMFLPEPFGIVIFDCSVASLPPS